MSKRARFGLVLGLLLSVALFQLLRLDSQLQRLQAEGFRVDLRIEHDPLLVFDAERQQGALVFSDRVERFRPVDLIALEWLDEVGSPQNPRAALRLQLRGVSLSELQLQGDDAQLRQWQRALQAWAAGR